MCIVSSIGDSWNRTVPIDYPWINPARPIVVPADGVSKEDFNKLKKEVQELKKLLKAAKRFDEKTGQKDCEIDEKVDFIKKVAELVGVDMKDVFDK